MKYPKLKFHIDQGLDTQTAIFFKKVKAGGINFKKTGLWQPHPALRRHPLTNKSIILYTDDYYRRRMSRIQTSLKKAASHWRYIAPVFFRLSSKIFHGHPWPKGKYICYLSIWNCNPIDPAEKTFQIYYQYHATNEIIIHELLHFLFYDYLQKKFPRETKRASSEKIWDLAETFNVLIMNLPFFRCELKLSRQLPYPKHKKLLLQMERYWTSNPDIEQLLMRFLN